MAPASGWWSFAAGQRPVPPLFLVVTAAVLLCLAACTPAVCRAPQPLATSLQEFLPHADRDHFVYVWHQVVRPGTVRAGIHVEHLTLMDNGEFDITLSEDGVVIGHTRFRDNGGALLLVSETLGRDLRLSYDPPLPQVEVPLYAGETSATATATVSPADDDTHVARLEVTQVVQASAASPVRSPLGELAHGVQLRTVRTLQFPEGPIVLTSTAVLVPGIGEIRSEGTATGAAPLYRELVCATIGGHPIGNCQTLKERVEELERAGSTNVR